MSQVIQNKGIQTISNGMKIWRNFNSTKIKRNGEVYYNMNFVKKEFTNIVLNINH